MAMPNLRTTRCDSADYLKTENDITAYLDAALNTNDAELLNRAVSVIARARGITQIPNQCGIKRESLCKALAEDGDRKLDTLVKVASSLREFSCKSKS